MFLKAAIDVLADKHGVDSRLATCIRFVADEVDPAVFYIHQKWAQAEALKGPQGSTNDLLFTKSDQIQKIDIRSEPLLAYLIQGSWERKPDETTGMRTGLVVPKRELILSGSPVVHKAQLASAGLNAQTAILCLAAVGLDVMLPNISFDATADEEIASLKERFRDERLQYLEVATNLADNAYEGIKSQDFHEVLKWAESEVAFKLVPKARQIEEALKSRSIKQLNAAGYSFWTDAVPAIGSAYMAGGLGPASIKAASSALSALVSAVASADERRSVPETAYAMKLKKAMS